MTDPGAINRGGDGARRAVEARLGDSWVIRWDTVAAERPEVRHAPGSPGAAGLCRSASGDVVVFDGYLFDRPTGAPEPPASDAALVASAYARRPEAFLDTIRGGFALAIWDEARRRLTVGRDAMGLHPCFYWWNGRTLLAAASLDALLARREVGAAFDRAVISEYLQNRCASHRAHETFYEGVHRLPPAHVLRAAPGRLDVSRYWDPIPPGFAWAGPREIAGFDDLLEQAVRRCLGAGGDSIALSGGFDSVSVATLAAAARDGRPPLHAVSLRFTGTVCDEGESQVAVARALGMPQLLRTLDEALDGEGFVGAALALSRTSPSPVLSPWQSAYSGLLRAASGLGLARLLMGTGGDDLLNVDPTYARDRLAALDLRALWRYCRACQRTSPFSPARVMRGVLWDHAAVPELAGLGGRVLARLHPTALDWVRRRRRQRAVSAWARPSDPALARRLDHRRMNIAAVPLAPGEHAYVETLRRLALGPLSLIEREQSHAWAGQLGFTFLFPYLDRDLVELSLRIPPDALIAGGRHKAPLRRLVAARLPSVTMQARKVDFTQAVHGVLRAEGQRVWRSLGGPAMLAELGLVDVARLDRFMGEYFASRNAHWLQAWIALSTEAWLRARSPLSFTSEQETAA